MSKVKEYAIEICEMLNNDYDGTNTHIDLLDVLAIHGYTIVPATKTNEASLAYFESVKEEYLDN
jgi:hypothetical protein